MNIFEIYLEKIKKIINKKKRFFKYNKFKQS